MGTSKEVQLREGETTVLGAYTLTFVKAERIAEPHRESVRARMDISRDGRVPGHALPAHEPVREPARAHRHPGRAHEPHRRPLPVGQNIDPDSGTVGLLVLVNPMVGWIWIATAVMALGGLVALLPSRAQSVARRRGPLPPPAPVPRSRWRRPARWRARPRRDRAPGVRVNRRALGWAWPSWFPSSPSSS